MQVHSRPETQLLRTVNKKKPASNKFQLVVVGDVRHRPRLRPRNIHHQSQKDWKKEEIEEEEEGEVGEVV